MSQLAKIVKLNGLGVSSTSKRLRLVSFSVQNVVRTKIPMRVDFFQDFSQTKFPRFVQGPYLRGILTMLPYYAKEKVYIMCPYMIQSEILDSILGLPDHLEVRFYTRDISGYLPNIKSGSQPALAKVRKKKNIKIFIENKIHAKIWLIDDNWSIVHSMNGTPFSEKSNFEAGIVSIDKELIKEIYRYFSYVETQAKRLQ